VQDKYAASAFRVPLGADSLHRYVEVLGCSNVSLTNTTNLYARYTTSFLCNAIVQASLEKCNEDSNTVAPLCADSCVCSCSVQFHTALMLIPDRPNSPSVSRT
jgi:hypothetical protein